MSIQRKREEAIEAFGCEVAKNANDLTVGELKGFLEEKWENILINIMSKK
eukprot:gnl/Chilomastix_caulleri/872.p1 GENE.gnl/Chilomastix_caulleri/872~~gnl/Chilomastix_caulleri/872.p1  ORF type:complete len:50 (+),score=12.29 gnl/Chilomastix_caulleri/872:186-335(+)